MTRLAESQGSMEERELSLNVCAQPAPSSTATLCDGLQADAAPGAM